MVFLETVKRKGNPGGVFWKFDAVWINSRVLKDFYYAPWRGFRTGNSTVYIVVLNRSRFSVPSVVLISGISLVPNQWALHEMQLWHVMFTGACLSGFHKVSFFANAGLHSAHCFYFYKHKYARLDSFVSGKWKLSNITIYDDKVVQFDVVNLLLCTPTSPGVHIQLSGRCFHSVTSHLRLLGVLPTTDKWHWTTSHSLWRWCIFILSPVQVSTHVIHTS